MVKTRAGSTFGLLADRLGPVCRASAASRLEPDRFFVARSGVITLAYRGFTTALLDLKRRVEQSLPDLPDENPGSRWAKTTLAALVDDTPLTPSEVQSLRLATADGDACLEASGWSLKADRVDLVELGCRSMERVTRRVSFAVEAGTVTGIPGAHRVAVEGVLSAWRTADHEGYAVDLARGGNRARHYRMTRREWSLVVPVEDPVPCLDSVRAAVERAMPGRYAWFDASAFHVTLRTLGRVPTDDTGSTAGSFVRRR